MTATTLDLVALDDLKPHPANPKTHAADLLDASLTEFGYIEPVVIDARTGLLISGHGRRETLTRLRDTGAPPPTGVTVDKSGAWQIPAVVGWASTDDLHAEAALVALNRIGEQGGWEDRALLAILDKINTDDAGPLAALAAGFDEANIAVLRRAVAADDIFTVGAGDMLDEWRGISGQTTTDYAPEYARKVTVFIRDGEAIADFCERLDILEPLGKDLNYPLGWTPHDRRKRPDDE